VNERLARLVEPFDVVEGRLTGLLGLLWFTGGAVPLLALALGAYDDSWLPGVIGVTVLAVVLGGVLMAAPTRVLSRAQYALLTVLGGAAIAFHTASAGPRISWVVASLFIYVSVFSFVSLRSLAWGVVGSVAAMHAIALWLTEPAGALGRWLLLWFVALLAGVLLGQVVEAFRRVLDEQARLVDQLREADAAKTDILRGVAHELSKPMTSIVGRAETLAARADAIPADQRDIWLQEIATSSRALHDSLGELLHLGSPADGRITLELRRVELAPVVERAVQLSGVPRDRVVLQDVQGQRIVADAPKIAHALANLLSNASKYGGPGPIEVRLDRQDGLVTILVEDHGPGIPDRAKARVFEPFERARTEDRGRGTGIGLSLVRQIARLHGGDSWAEDRPGGGARFCLAIGDGRSPGDDGLGAAGEPPPDVAGAGTDAR
jgi:signal transduction histidine kinase